MKIKQTFSLFFLVLLYQQSLLAEHICHTEVDDLGKEIPMMMDMSNMDLKFNQIKQNLPNLSKLDNLQLQKIMKSMGPNYYWPINNGKSSKHGVLIMAHGYGSDGDLDLFNSLKNFNPNYEIILTMGMSMMTSKHVICSVQRLINSGIESIYIVPISSTPYNTLVRQWRYIFNLEKNYSYADVDVLASNTFKYIEPISDDAIAKEIILEYANEISTNQENEVVIIIAHGPVSQADNVQELLIMNNIADYISNNSNFSEVRSFTLQDDAGKAIRDNNINNIRQYIKNSSMQGKRVLVVSNLMSGKGIQKNIEKDLNGLNYTFNSKGLLTHPKFKIWIEDSITK